MLEKQENSSAKTIVFFLLPFTPTSGTGNNNCGLGFSFFACSQTKAVRPKQKRW